MNASTEMVLSPTTLASVPSSPPLDPRYLALSPTSSEPPLFSSDGPLEAEAITNYESPRTKRKRAGPWWHLHTEDHPGRKAKKSKLTRNFDSGVFLPSDSSELSIPQTTEPEDSSKMNLTDALPTHVSQSNARSEPGMAMLRVLQTCLEMNAETYDLSAMTLRDSDLSHLSLLNQVIKAPSENRVLVPDLYLNLSKNHLVQLNPHLFTIENLTTLILRGNGISNLSPSLADLKRLRHLDVSLNDLKFLPSAILELFSAGQLERFNTLGNPFFGNALHERCMIMYEHYISNSPAEWSQNEFISALGRVQAQGGTGDDLVWLIRVLDAWKESVDTPDNDQIRPKAVFLATTCASYFDEDGVPLAGSAEPLDQDADSLPIALQLRKASTSKGIVHRSALFESGAQFAPPCAARVLPLGQLALINCLDQVPVSQLRTWLDEQGMFPSINRLLDQADENQGKPRTCDTCGRHFVRHRAEWTEWWSHFPMDMFPVKKFVCSWGCVPSDLLAKAEEPIR